MPAFLIIIPCYNEEKRLPIEKINNFLREKKDVGIIFADDGSSDKTAAILEKLNKANPTQTKIISQKNNKGKAEAVRNGMLNIPETMEYVYAGYLDADLSTSLEEFYDLYLSASCKNFDYIFGSRIKMKNTSIQRKFFRHISGRLVASVVDFMFDLGIYDTQCGAKCFKKEMIEPLFENPFKTKWLFDIEIFLRINRLMPDARCIEVPIRKWKDYGGSKINIMHFPEIVKEIILLKKCYRKFKQNP